MRLLAPFDPVVWDRRRFELLWGWAYRFEAYTPAAKCIRGYYALPLLWRDHVIGWGNLSVNGGVLHTELGYVAGHAPRDKAFRAALDEELGRMESFLNLKSQCGEMICVQQRLAGQSQISAHNHRRLTQVPISKKTQGLKPCLG